MVRFRFVLLLALGLAVATTASAQDAGVAVVVHADVRDSLDIAKLRRIFLLRQRFWANRTAVTPVNQGARSDLRLEFSTRVLGATPQALREYWNDLWFHGTAPPATLASDDAVLRFVAQTPGAIGYVRLDPRRALPDGVRVALVLP